MKFVSRRGDDVEKYELGKALVCGCRCQDELFNAEEKCAGVSYIHGRSEEGQIKLLRGALKPGRVADCVDLPAEHRRPLPGSRSARSEMLTPATNLIP